MEVGWTHVFLDGVRKGLHLPLQVLLDSDVAQVMNNPERPRNLPGSTAVSHLYFACDFSVYRPQLVKTKRVSNKFATEADIGISFRSHLSFRSLVMHACISSEERVRKAKRTTHTAQTHAVSPHAAVRVHQPHGLDRLRRRHHRSHACPVRIHSRSYCERFRMLCG